VCGHEPREAHDGDNSFGSGGRWAHSSVPVRRRKVPHEQCEAQIPSAAAGRRANGGARAKPTHTSHPSRGARHRRREGQDGQKRFTILLTATAIMWGLLVLAASAQPRTVASFGGEAQVHAHRHRVRGPPLDRVVRGRSPGSQRPHQRRARPPSRLLLRWWQSGAWRLPQRALLLQREPALRCSDVLLRASRAARPPVLLGDHHPSTPHTTPGPTTDRPPSACSVRRLGRCSLSVASLRPRPSR
jgi:hypothetical protein